MKLGKSRNVEEKKVRAAISDDTLERVVGGVGDPEFVWREVDPVSREGGPGPSYNMGKSVNNGGGIVGYR